MKNLLKVTLLLFGILILNTANAQEISKKAKQKISTQVEEMATVMELDESQKAKMLEIKTALFIKNKELADKYEKGTEDYKVAKKKNMKNYQMQLKNICSKEQLSKWQQHRKKK